MKLINRDTDYAIRALIYIAKSGKERVSVSEIVRELNMPRPFLRKILQLLKKKGLLKSYDGRIGGFSLAVSIEGIFLTDLIEIFQGPLNLVDCLFKQNVCHDVATCALKKKVEHIEDMINTELKGVTVASLVSHS